MKFHHKRKKYHFFCLATALILVAISIIPVRLAIANSAVNCIHILLRRRYANTLCRSSQASASGSTPSDRSRSASRLARCCSCSATSSGVGTRLPSGVKYRSLPCSTPRYKSSVSLQRQPLSVGAIG